MSGPIRSGILLTSNSLWEQHEGARIAMTTTCVQCAASTTRCACCETHVCEEHALVGQQLITARHLVMTIFSTAVRAPSLLGDVLFKELDKVAYCTTCRPQIAVQRQNEQLKLLAGMMLVMLLAVVLLAYTIL